jgi:hypothetical protein
LRDELQSTEKHEWTRESKLRDQKISFVSAGSMTPIDEPKPALKKVATNRDADLRNSEHAMAQMDINAPPSIPSLDDTEDVDMQVAETVHMHATITVPVEEVLSQQIPTPSPPQEDAPMFFVDTAGDESLAFKGPKSVHAPRAPSPTGSSSSDEVVFRGRNGVTIRDDPVAAHKPAPTISSKPSLKSAPSQPIPQTNHQMERFLNSLDNPPDGWAKELVEKSKSRMSSTHHADRQPAVDPTSAFAANRLDQDLSGVVRSSRKGKKNRKRQNRLDRLEQDLEDELLQDYIQNIAAEDMPTMTLGADSDDTDEFFDNLLNKEEKDPDDVDVTALEDEWEDESDSEEDDQVDDDDEDNDDDDDEDTGSEDSSDLEARLLREEQEAWEDDADIRERRALAMTDEEFARLIMKQQELGLGGDEIELFDDRFGDIGGAREALASYSVKTPKSGKKGGKKKGGRKSDHFPDATLMADVLEQDAYGGFDVMDYDRPSLRKKNKGRKSGPLPEELGLSDSDLVEELQNQWANDRSKKASKKAEREELRQLGLIGKKNKFKPDLNTKYSEGITMAQVRFELQEFLEQDDHTTKAFPPMMKADRKVLHEFANQFNLKSKSVGNGQNRAPVLIKTQRTVEWNEEHFSRVSNFVGRGYLKNASKKSRSTLGGDIRRTRQMGGGGGGGAAAYRHGDVVGHNASEISANNFGRKLMEKMGWASGMSLGKEGSSGLLVPVQATIRSGKAGLG